MDSLSRPLVVDLEAAMLHCDLAAERSVQRLLKSPLRWLGQQDTGTGAETDLAVLPWNLALIDWLRAENARGRRLFLVARASNGELEHVAAHFGFFDATLVHAGNARTAADHAFGAEAYEYIGRGQGRARAPDTSGVRAWLRACRLHQWLKNLLVFLPLLAAHSGELALWGKGLLAFFCFGLCASSVYLLNDLLDLDNDRHHPSKCKRPFAAGLIGVRAGLVAGVGLLAAAAGLSLLLPPRFGLVLALYVAMTMLYSLGLKKRAILDVLWLAALYTIRVVAGAAATGIVPSIWLLCFSMFTFLSLACLKRYTELMDLSRRQRSKVRGRGYQTDDAQLIAMQGMAAGYLAVLVLILYINSPAVGAMYTTPEWLWGIGVALLYWFNRSWWLAHHGQLHDDPIVYAATDRVSHRIFALCIFCLVAATWTP